MNLIPQDILDDVYQIEKYDYVTHNIANTQPQQLLNRLTYINARNNDSIDDAKDSDDSVIDGFYDEDENIEQAIEEVEAQSDVVDIVGTYAQLQAYSTSSLKLNDVVKVIADETHDNLSTFYRWNGLSFVYISYERNSIPVTISQSITVQPQHDVVYIMNGSNLTLTIDMTNMYDGMSLTIQALQRCNIVWSTHTETINAGDTITMYALGNTFKLWIPDILNDVYPVGTVIWSNLSSIPFNGTWQKLDEGYTLSPNTSDIGIEQGSNSITITPSNGTTGGTSITVNMLPRHYHTISATLELGGSHTHSGYVRGSASNRGGSTSGTYGNNASTSQYITESVEHNHSCMLWSDVSTQYTNDTADAHTHSFTVESTTISIMQASYAYYAWKRVS